MKVYNTVQQVNVNTTWLAKWLAQLTKESQRASYVDNLHLLTFRCKLASQLAQVNVTANVNFTDLEHGSIMTQGRLREKETVNSFTKGNYR